MASENESACVDGKFSWPCLSITPYIMYEPWWLTESLNHQVTGLLFWFNETISLTQQFFRMSYNIFECKTFPPFIFYFLFQHKNTVKIYFYDHCFTSKHLLFIFVLWTPNVIQTSWRLYTMCILECKLQAGRIYSEHWLMLHFPCVSLLPPSYSPWALQHTHLCH